METNQDFLNRFFGVALQGRTYLNLLYLFIMFPLGIIYFTVVVTGFSISIGLLILVIGIFIALLFLILVRGISMLHLHYASSLLGFELPPKVERVTASKGFFDHLKKILSDGKTYTSMVYMFLELPLGIIYFTLIITFLSVSVTFTFSPILWILNDEGIVFLSGDDWLWNEDFGNTVFLSLVGIVLFFGTLHLGNLLAKVEEFLCKNLLVRIWMEWWKTGRMGCGNNVLSNIPLFHHSQISQSPNNRITQPGQARTKKKKNLPTEMKSHRNEFLVFLILRDFNSESKKVFALCARM